ncbi:hypothetical protein ACQPZJ_08790 [Actinoplanes sp. CA-054009]
MTERENWPLGEGEPAPEGSLPMATVDETDAEVVPVPSRGGCRTELHGWAGAHLHGAVRPRRRAAGRGRPPGRWC